MRDRVSPRRSFRVAITGAAVATCTFGVPALAEITVPPAFSVDVLLDQIDGRTPRLTAISNPDYGFGVIATAIDEGILTVLRISQNTVELLGTLSGFEADTFVADAAFDPTGLFDNHLYLSVVHSIPACNADGYTEFYRVRPGGAIEQCGVRLGDDGDELHFRLAFTSGAAGYTPGAYLEDSNGCDGTSLWHMVAGCASTPLAQNHLPPGRTDLDVVGMEFDLTGAYGSRLTLADCDANNENLAVIYQLAPDLSWTALTTPVTTQERCYRDLTISSGGVFGESIYVTDAVSGTVMSVDASGVHTVFASGFTEVLAVTVDDNSSSMFVSDTDGIYRIRPSGQVPGPTILMREPRVTADDVHTGAGGVAFARVLFNEPVVFDESDVTIADAGGSAVPFVVAGSGSPFMVITFAQTLVNDVYTITINDTVVSTADGTAIDGDNDGATGGDAVITMEHRCRTDTNDDGEIGFDELLEVLSSWGPCP